MPRPGPRSRPAPGRAAAGVPLALIRHAATAWNAENRIQGRADVPLSEAGRAEVARWRLPPDLAGYRWVTSPLARARETAALLGATAPAVEPRLTEMDWGAWDGLTAAELPATMDELRRAHAEQGLDFRPPGGESFREVRARVAPWLAEVATAGVPTLAVAHKVVMRAVLSLATGCGMGGPDPAGVDWRAIQVFRVGPGGEVAADRLNVPLVPGPGRPAGEPGP